MNYGIPYAYYSSQTQFNYGPVYALDAHKREYFRIKSGLGDPTLSMADYELEFYRQNSGLSSTATDSQHFDAYYDNLTLPDPTWVNALRADAVTARGIVNLATNPSFETAGATVEVRRNLFQDPYAVTVSPTRWSTTGNTPVLSRESGAAFGLDYAARSTQGTNGALRFGPIIQLTAGIEYRVRMVIRSDVYRSNWQVQYRPQGVSIATNQTTIHASGYEIGTAPQVIEATFTPIVSGGSSATFGIISTSVAGGGWLEITEVTVEVSSTPPGPPFSGSYSPDVDLTPSWTGTPNDSESILTGSRAATWPVSMQNCVAILSTRWAASGTKSLRVIPTVPSANNSTPYSTLSALGLEIGKTYTVLATLRLEAPLVGPFNAASRTLSLNTGGISAQAPNEAGVHQLRITFNYDGTINHPGSTLRFYHGVAAGGGDAWWDNFMIVEGNYSGTYFDGDSHGAIWLGAEHASQSATYPEFVN